MEKRTGINHEKSHFQWCCLYVGHLLHQCEAKAKESNPPPHVVWGNWEITVAMALCSIPEASIDTPIPEDWSRLSLLVKSSQNTYVVELFNTFETLDSKWPEEQQEIKNEAYPQIARAWNAMKHIAKQKSRSTKCVRGKLSS